MMRNTPLLSLGTSSTPIPPGSIYFGGMDPGRFLVTGPVQVAGKAVLRFSLSLKMHWPTKGVTYDMCVGCMGNRIYVPTDDYDATKALK